MWRNDALRLLASAYREMGLLDLAADTERVLQLNTNAPAASDEISGFTPVAPPPSYIDQLFSS